MIPLPTNKFVLKFVDNLFSTDLYRRFYSEYSFFVHSYFSSWHVLPFSSVLEFKIFKYELNNFSNEIKKLFTGFNKILSGLLKRSNL